MTSLILQLQLLLAALSAFLPLIPPEHRARIGGVFEVVSQALAAGGSIANNADDLAAKLAAIRAEVEAMATRGRAVSVDELDAAVVRIRTASAAFRAALETAEAGA